MLRQAQHVDNYFHEFRQEFSQDELFIGVEIVRLILAFRLYNSIRIRLKARISGGLKNPYSCSPLKRNRKRILKKKIRMPR